MAKAPKNRELNERKDDNWGVGQQDDGSINVIAPEDFAASLAQRHADENAFNALIDEGDDNVDLEDAEALFEGEQRDDDAEGSADV